MSDGERGSVSVLAAAILGVCAILVIAATGAARVVVIQHRLAAAADASALAAADAASGYAPGDPCDRAEALAAANGAVVDACRVEPAVATVRVIQPVGPLRLSATATAGAALDLRGPSADRSLGADSAASKE